MCSICSVLCLCCLPVAEVTSLLDERPDQKFVVRAQVLEALEGGPLVVLVTLEYKGEKDIKIGINNRANRSNVAPRAKWKFRPVDGIMTFGPQYGQEKLSPGDKLSEVHCVHHGWHNIPKGPVVLEVNWRIHEPGERGKQIACPDTSLEVDIPPATKESVRALGQRLEEKLGRDKVTEEERRKLIREVIDYLRYTNQPGLAPVAWRLIESFPDAYPVLDFLPMVYAGAEDRGAVNCRLVKLARDPNYPELGNIFWYWRRERVTLSADEMAPLLRSENVWTRALTGATFTDRCGKEWTDQLFRDLRASQEPLPGERFARLLSQLDNDDFATRERATRALQQHGEPVRAQLLKALQGKPTPEVKSRVQRVLDEIAKGPPPIVRTTLWLLENADNPQSQAMLNLLAEGPTDSWATTEAKTILAKREGQKRK